MKRSIITILLIPSFTIVLQAQNIGIGDPVPSAKLTVRGSETAVDGQAAAIKLQNTSSTNAWYLRAGAPGTNTPNNAFSIADNSGYHFTIGQFGNIGVGINPTTAKLHINGEMRIQGTNVFEFGAGVAGKEPNAGKIGYNAFGQNALTFVGGGTNATNRAFYFYGEGGTTFNGPVNVGGTLQFNGNPGTTGQVLTSNGTSDPAWKNSSYADNTRFAVLFNENTGNPNGDAVIWSTLYNLNTTNVAIGASSITINKTGLYHFDFSMSSAVSHAAAPVVYPSHELWFYFGLSNPIQLIVKKLEPIANTNTSWKGQEKVSVELYITAPANLHFHHILNHAGGSPITSYNVQGFITGHLISE